MYMVPHNVQHLSKYNVQFSTQVMIVVVVRVQNFLARRKKKRETKLLSAHNKRCLITNAIYEKRYFNLVNPLNKRYVYREVN